MEGSHSPRFPFLQNFRSPDTDEMWTIPLEAIDFRLNELVCATESRDVGSYDGAFVLSDDR